MIDIWKDIEGYSGRYKISNNGKVKSMPWPQKHSKGNSVFTKYGRLISIRIGKSFNGYSGVSLTKDGKQKSFFLHILIAKAFIHNPENKPCVNHRNGIKTDNRIENLEWVTKSENSIHSFSIGLQCNKGEKHPLHKLTESQVLNIRSRYSCGESSYQIYKSLGNISYTTIKEIISKKTWSHL